MHWERNASGAIRPGENLQQSQKMNEEQRELAKRLLKEGKSVREVARTFVSVRASHVWLLLLE